MYACMYICNNSSIFLGCICSPDSQCMDSLLYCLASLSTHSSLSLFQTLRKTDQNHRVPNSKEFSSEHNQ